MVKKDFVMRMFGRSFFSRIGRHILRNGVLQHSNIQVIPTFQAHD